MTHLLEREDILYGQMRQDVEENVVWHIDKAHPAAGTMEREEIACMFILTLHKLGSTSQARLSAVGP